METYLQYRRLGASIKQQLNNDVENARQLKCLSRQQTRVVNGRDILVVEWDSENDGANPRNWSRLTKFKCTIIVGSIAFLVGAVAPVDTPVIELAAKSLGVSQVVESLAQAVYLCGFGVGALVVGPFSEVLGRNFSYIVPLALFCIWIMASALSPNIGAQVVFRFLAGFCGATPLVCAGGSLSDLYTPLEKTYMFPFFAICGFGGPAIGPVMTAWIPGSVLHSWRWTEWIALLFSGVVFAITFLFMPETHAPTLLSWKAKQLRRAADDERYYALHEIEQTSLYEKLTVALPRPFVMAWHEPVIVLITLYMSVVYIVLFTFFTGYTFIFRETYGISTGLTNTIFIAISIGVLFGAIPVPFVYRMTVKAQLKAEAEGKKQFEPEMRLWYSMLGAAVSIPISLFWMGWTAYPSVSIWSPILASALFGFGVIGFFISSYMYLIDMYEMYAASALTLATLVRYVAAGGMTVVGIPFYSNVGVHWTLTILGCLSALLAPLPYLFYWFGPKIRARSRFAMNKTQGGIEKTGTKDNKGDLPTPGRGLGSANDSPRSTSSETLGANRENEEEDEEKIEARSSLPCVV